MTIHRMHRESKGGRRLIWVLLLLVLLGGTAGYFTLHPEQLPAWAARTGLGRDLQTTTLYKWRDASGAWHVGDRPPPDGTPYETTGYTRDTNVLPLPPKLQQ